MKRLILAVVVGISLLLSAHPASATTSTSCNVPICVQDVTPNDPLFSQQYGPQRLAAPAAWSVTEGTTTVIAVVDTGVDCTHPDVGVKCTPGYDFVNNHPLTGTENSDDYGHGTHVACIAACVTNNGVGVAGLNWNAKVMPVKVCNSAGGCDSLAIESGNHFAADNGANIINMSLGGSSQFPDGVDYAYGKGVLVISACGNTGTNPCLYPAADVNSMAVSCSDKNDVICSFSSSGSAVDVSAPGLNVLAAVPTGGCGLCDPSGYRQLSGTSMSTPHVTGTASLIRGQHPEYSADQIWGLLEQSADDRGSTGFDLSYGFGRVNAYNAVTQAAPAGRLSKGTLPPPPTFAFTTPTDGSMVSANGWKTCIYTDDTAIDRVEFVLAFAGGFHSKSYATDYNGQRGTFCVNLAAGTYTGPDTIHSYGWAGSVQRRSASINVEVK